MACKDCNSGPVSTFSVQYFYNDQCFNCEDAECGGDTTNAKCVFYSGPNLSCSGVNTSDSLEFAMQKFDEKLCTTVGDVSTYNLYCLRDEFSPNTQQDVSEAIAYKLCTNAYNIEQFTETTFVNYQSAVDSRFEALEYPQVTCSSAFITPTASLSLVFSRICAKLTALTSADSIAGVTWDNCYSVAVTPTTVSYVTTISIPVSLPPFTLSYRAPGDVSVVDPFTVKLSTDPEAAITVFPASPPVVG